MKREILIAAVCIITTSLFSQTYKLETIFTDKNSETYLSYWKVLENTNISQVDTFSLWGINKTHEVEYYKGNAKEIYVFLNQIIKFLEKYKEEDKVLTYISGVQVKTLKQMGIKYSLVYDKERKIFWTVYQKRWTEMLDKFVSYCENQKINYK